MIWRVVYDAINLTSCFPTFYVSRFYKFKITNNYIYYHVHKWTMIYCTNKTAQMSSF